MNNILILNKDTYENISEKVFVKSSFLSNEFNQNFFPSILFLSRYNPICKGIQFIH